jgi:hypothetical protein
LLSNAKVEGGGQIEVVVLVKLSVVVYVEMYVVKEVRVDVNVVPTLEIVIVIWIVEVTVFAVCFARVLVVVGVLSVVYLVEVDVTKQANVILVTYPRE